MPEDLYARTKRINAHFGKLSTDLTLKVAEKEAENNKFRFDKKTLCNKSNGISERLASFSYHLHLLRRELDEEESARMAALRLGMAEVDLDRIIHDSSWLMRQRGNFLLRDMIADFFGAFENCIGIVELLYPAVKGKTLSKKINSLGHAHMNAKPFAVHILSNWDVWLKCLYNGYRKDAIHALPNPCGSCYSRRFSYPGPGTVTIQHNFILSLPAKVAYDLKLAGNVELFQFCADIQDKLVIFIEELFDTLP